jgi:hypothetical protein
MEELEKLEYPKPLQDFVYTTFNAFADRHPWVSGENIRPKSIAREMFEQFRSFAEYVLDYDLQRVEGLLLRHLNSVYKVLAQTVPDQAKTDELFEMEDYLRTMLRGVDSSLADEWERMKDPEYQPFAVAGRAVGQRPPGAPGESDVTADARKFTASVRTRIFTFLRAWSTGGQSAALAVLDWQDDDEGAPWGTDRLQDAFDAYRGGHALLRLDPEARNLRHTHVEVLPGGAGVSPAGTRWRITQVLIDPELENDWAAIFVVDLATSREAGRPIVRLARLGSLA